MQLFVLVEHGRTPDGDYQEFRGISTTEQGARDLCPYPPHKEEPEKAHTWRVMNIDITQGFVHIDRVVIVTLESDVWLADGLPKWWDGIPAT